MKEIMNKGTINANENARINQAIGLQVIYGHDLGDNYEQQKLVRYLERLVAKLDVLSLRGFPEANHLRRKHLSLDSLYILQATERIVPFAKVSKQEIRRYVDREGTILPVYSPEDALPDVAILQKNHSSEEVLLKRALLATESVAQNKKCVLLGVPGSGKSTFMRHIAWSLAKRELDDKINKNHLYGWENTLLVLPILLPLRRLAGALVHVPETQWDTTVSDSLQAAIAQYDYDKTDATGLLRESLDQGKTLLLFDGLDEVPVEPTPNTASRFTTLQAVQSFTDLYPDTLAVITCRTRAFTNDLRDCLAWKVETLAPFTMGQIRHFALAWYGELAKTTELTSDQASNLQKHLIDEIAKYEKLHQIAENPLLLTLISLTTYYKGKSRFKK